MKFFFSIFVSIGIVRKCTKVLPSTYISSSQEYNENIRIFNCGRCHRCMLMEMYDEFGVNGIRLLVWPFIATQCKPHKEHMYYVYECVLCKHVCECVSGRARIKVSFVSFVYESSRKYDVAFRSLTLPITFAR